jgi:hypothetical protein
MAQEVECLPRLREARGSIPSTKRKAAENVALIKDTQALRAEAGRQSVTPSHQFFAVLCVAFNGVRGAVSTGERLRTN